jgi:uncharacterized protein YecE (DUF72 family)
LIFVGTSGWQIPRTSAHAFPNEGSTLQRYAARFPAVEINSSFYRSHRDATWERWRDATPEGFRFAVKAPRAITHERKLREAGELLEAFAREISLLGEKLGPVLVQLPPSLAFEAEVVRPFLDSLREAIPGSVALEPRHPSWFQPEPDALLANHRVARVAADPARVPEAAIPGGWTGLAYHRLHGSPHMYRSAYGPERIAPMAAEFRAGAPPAWVFFDNTTSGAAAADALLLQAALSA